MGTLDTLEPWAKINPFLLKLLLSGVYIHRQDKTLRRSYAPLVQSQVLDSCPKAALPRVLRFRSDTVIFPGAPVKIRHVFLSLPHHKFGYFFLYIASSLLWPPLPSHHHASREQLETPSPAPGIHSQNNHQSQPDKLPHNVRKRDRVPDIADHSEEIWSVRKLTDDLVIDT